MTITFLSYIILWLLVLGLGVVTLGLLRQVGLLHLRVGPRGGLETSDGPEVGEAVAPFETTDIDGVELSLGLPGKLTLIFVVSPTCSVCHDLVPAIRAFGRYAPPHAVIIALSLGATADSRQFADVLQGIPVVADTELAHRLGVTTAPFVLKIENGSLVAKGVVNSLEQIEILAASELSSSEGHAFHEIG